MKAFALTALLLNALFAAHGQTVIQATVSFSSTNSGMALNPAFCGLSYEKDKIEGYFFDSTNTALINMFGQIAPAVLRIGGNSSDITCWGGISNSTPITTAEVDRFAGFIKALPGNWRVIYGINMSVNSPTNCAAEAAYVANALGSRLLGFEIGNEPDLYYGNGIRSTNFTYAQYLSQWQALAAGITNTVPGWAITNAGSGWVLTGPAAAYNTEGYTVPFAQTEAGVISMSTQHYYLGNGEAPSATIQFLLQPDPTVPGTVSNIVTAANPPLGFRMDECGSFYSDLPDNGGAPGVSDAYGSALWTLDFMFTCALNGSQGVNFHGGGDAAGYTPIADNGTSVEQARPEFYGLKMFSLVSQGGILPAGLSLGSNINFSAYGVRRANGGISAVLINKETNDSVQVAMNLGSLVTMAQWIELTGPDLSSTNGYTIGGATINADGSWSGGVESVSPATDGQLTVTVPPITAILLNPVVPVVTNLKFSVTGNQFNVSWPANDIGLLLQSNSVSLAMTNDWFTVPGSAATNNFQISIAPAQANVFYRLAHP
jgi:hypothetical protein